MNNNIANPYRFFYKNYGKMPMRLHMCVFFCTFAAKFVEYDFYAFTCALPLLAAGRIEQSGRDSG